MVKLIKTAAGVNFNNFKRFICIPSITKGFLRVVFLEGIPLDKYDMGHMEDAVFK